MSNTLERSSLSQTDSDMVQRDHLHQHLHSHQHKRLHRDVQPRDTTITEVTQTVAVVQQVDSASSVLPISTYTLGFSTSIDLASSTSTDLSSSSAPFTTSTASSLDTASPSASVVVPSSSAVSTDSETISTLSPSSTSITSSPTSSSVVTSTPYLTSSTYSSLLAANASSILSSGSSNTSTFLATSASASAAAVSGLTTLSSSLISSSTSSLISSFTTYSISSAFSTTISSDFSSTTGESTHSQTGSSSSSTDAVGNPIGGSATAVGTAATSSSTADGGSGGSDDSPATQPGTVVGGVIGGIAGIALIAVILLYIVRWKKGKPIQLPLGLSRSRYYDRSESPEMINDRSMTEVAPPPAAAVAPAPARRGSLAMPAAFAALTGKRASGRTERTVSTAESERGFYKVSGRKIPSVFQHGGDGYGGGSTRALSETSFYLDQDGFHGGEAPFPSDTSPHRPPSGIPVLRPSPARTPVTEQGPFAPMPPPPRGSPRRDGVGRSHPSNDNSRAASSISKFTEEV